MHFKFRNVNDAFSTLVKGIHEGTILTNTVPSRAGEVLVVEEPVTISYESPWERVLFNEPRDPNCFFHLFESLWMLAGRNDVAPLEYYSSDIGKIASDDGKTFNGAYGYRWQKAKYSYTADTGQFDEDRVGKVDQLKILIEHLNQKPESRRAVLQMWNVEDDLLKIDVTKDVCCNTNVYFLVENGPCRECAGDGLDHPESYASRNSEFGFVPCPVCKGVPSDRPRYLNMTVCNRSNDMIWGLLGANVVHFSFLQEYMAACIGLDPGWYHQFTNNMHVYTERWNPEEWLAPYNPRRDMHSPKIYSYASSPDWRRVRLVSNPARFDEECKDFVERHGRNAFESGTIRDYSEPFLQTVALPMSIAFHYHKRRMYPEALVALASVAADDWRIAGELWIKKRRDGWNKRMENATDVKHESTTEVS